MATLTSPSVGTSVRAASEACLGNGALAVSLNLLGTDALVFYRPDLAETDRRRQVKAAQLASLEPLETLLTLPVGLPVGMGVLAPQLRSAVERLPWGAADRDQREVTRHAVRPLAIDLAVVRATGPGWRGGLERASRFAPFCARALLLDRPSRRDEDLLMEAAFYGIGVLFDGEDGTEMVLEPRPYRPQRHTAAAWCFIEEFAQRLP